MRNLLILCVVTLAYGQEWTYYNPETSPAKWSEFYPDCGGQSQSPINIETAASVQTNEVSPLNFTNFSKKATEMVLTNTGHSAKVDVPGEYFLTGRGLGQRYDVVQFHFHFGTENSKGSEHTVDGKAYPMEMHIVSYNSGQYRSFGEAATKPNGLAVVGVFFEVGSEKNDALQIVADKLGSIKKFESKVTLGSTFALADLLPDDKKSYWRYSGSLTTPGCFESVIWTIMKNPVTITQEQIDAFRGSMNGENDEGFPNNIIGDNFRPVQPINGRIVYTS